MMNLFKHRRASSGTTSSSPLVSSRTGGFEIPRLDDGPIGFDDDTIMDETVYTDNIHHDAMSTAVTVKQSSNRRYHNDVETKIEAYRARQKASSPSSDYDPGPNPVTPTTSQKSIMSDCTSSPLLGLKLIDKNSSEITPPVRYEWNEPTPTPKSRLNMINVADDGSCTSDSVHSFSYKQDKDGAGFELDVDEEERDDQSESTLGSVIKNCSDEDLMERHDSPGALRLTAEGLQRHERKVFKESFQDKPRDKFHAWKQTHETRKWYREKHRERHEQLTDQSIRNQQKNMVQENSESTEDSKKRSKKLRSVLSRPFKREPDVTDFSLAPLNTLEDLPLPVQEDKPKEKKKFGLVGLFRKNSSSSTAQAILEKERLAYLEEQKRKRHLGKQEKAQIEVNRQIYLERQRKLEGSVSQRSRSSPAAPRSKEDTIILRSSMDVVKKKSHPLSASTADISTISSRTSLPMCVVCKRNERSHISIPCMHFSFCANCAQKHEQMGVCVVCNERNVTFARVSV